MIFDASKHAHPVFTEICIVMVIAVVGPERSTFAKFPDIDDAAVPTPFDGRLITWLVCVPQLRRVSSLSTTELVVFTSDMTVPAGTLKRYAFVVADESPATRYLKANSPLGPIGVMLRPDSAVISLVVCVMRPDGLPANVVGDPTVAGFPLL